MSAQVDSTELPKAEAVAAPGLHSPPDSTTKHDDSDSELSELDDALDEEPTADFMKNKTEPTIDDSAIVVDQVPSIDAADATTEDAVASQQIVADAITENTPVPTTEPMDIDPPDTIEDAAPEIIEPFEFDGGVPVFKPTDKDFEESFESYMKRVVNHWGMQTGIAKVIAPPEWLKRQPRLDETIKTIRVHQPISQEIQGSNQKGYRQLNIQHSRSYNLPEWRSLCDRPEHQPPAKRGEKRPNQEFMGRAARSKPTVPRTPRSSTSGPSRGRGRPPKKTKTSQDAADPTDPQDARLPTPDSPNDEGDDEVKEATVSARRLNNRRANAGKIDHAAFEDFDYEDHTEYTRERCEELERFYWRSLTYAPPLYGADMPGSLFTDETKEWNLGNLPNVLDCMGDQKIPGVNTAYLYLGMWKATFAWHLEDVDLYSINYLHFGAPKQWYSISQGDAPRFEAAMKSLFPEDAKACDQFLRHKTFLISPSGLEAKYGVKVNKIIHRPGEFVITFPYGYHSGYNLGYNCAEAVNFGLENWFEYGKQAKRCDCAQAQDSVWIDAQEIERKHYGWPTPSPEPEEYYEYTEEEDDGEDADGVAALTPPDSSTDGKLKSGVKRKRTKDGKQIIKKIRFRAKGPAKEPCVLCPNDRPDLELLPTSEGKKAHRLCAEYTIEVAVEKDVNGADVVVGVPDIDKARLALKCNYCRSVKGACMQCSQKKCVRAYHATCAAAAGVFVEAGETCVFGEDGTEYKDDAIEFSCRFHRTKRDKKIDGVALEDDVRIKTAALALEVGQTVQMQQYRGEIFAGTVLENRKSEEILVLSIQPRGSEPTEVCYKWLLVPDPLDYHLPKPSANAIPMPTSKQAKQSLVTSKRLADDIPRAEDVFTDGREVWAEFHTAEPKNPHQAKVNLSKDNQLWYYLGQTSTLARAQYSHDPKIKVYNTKSNFLDSLPKPALPLPIQRQSMAASYPSHRTQVTSTQSKSVVRPQNYLTNSAPPRSDKPYTYKPRSNSQTVDQSAYNMQRKFVEQSVQRPQAQHTSQWRPPILPPGYSLPPNSRSMAPPKAGECQPQRSSSISSQTSGRHSFTNSGASYLAGRPPSSGGVKRPSPNPFAKYAYLQKEHNHSPLDYKSPYRPGPDRGFMNGYEGNLASYLRNDPKALYDHSRRSSAAYNALSIYGSKITSSPSPVLSNSHSAYNGGNRIPSSPAGSTSSSISMPKPQTYGGIYASISSSIMPTQQRVPNLPITKPSTNLWEKKPPGQLHPAIRQEYTKTASIWHQNYQPPAPSPTAAPSSAPAPSSSPTPSSAPATSSTPTSSSVSAPSPAPAPASAPAKPVPPPILPQKYQTPNPTPTKAPAASPAPILPPKYQAASSTTPDPRPISTTPILPPKYAQALNSAAKTSSAPAAAKDQAQTTPISIAPITPYSTDKEKPLYPHQQYFQRKQDKQEETLPAPQTPKRSGPTIDVEASPSLVDCPPDLGAYLEKILKNVSEVAKRNIDAESSEDI